jgi:hypothetical protein
MDPRLEEMLRAGQGVYQRQRHRGAVTAQELAAATGVSGWGVAKVVVIKEREGIRDGGAAGILRSRPRSPLYARIRRCALTPREFSEEGGELTPTQKVRRGVVTVARVLSLLYQIAPAYAANMAPPLSMASPSPHRSCRV